MASVNEDLTNAELNKLFQKHTLPNGNFYAPHRYKDVTQKETGGFGFVA